MQLLFAASLLIAVLCLFWSYRNFGYASVWNWRSVVLIGCTALVCALLTIPPWIVVSKAMGLLLMPLGILWILLAVATCLGQGYTRYCSLAAWLILSIAGNPWFGAWLMAGLEAPYAVNDPFEERALDAVIVLGGGTGAPLASRPQLGAAGDRVLLGAQLSLSGRSALLVTCGSSPGTSMVERDLSRDTAEIWRSLRIHNRVIIEVPGPTTTSQEIAAIAELLDKHDWQRVGIVSSAWHLRRIMGLAQRQGLDLIPLAADVRGVTPPASLVNLIPQASGLDNVQTALWEYLGAWVGR